MFQVTFVLILWDFLTVCYDILYRVKIHVLVLIYHIVHSFSFLSFFLSFFLSSLKYNLFASTPWCLTECTVPSLVCPNKWWHKGMVSTLWRSGEEAMRTDHLLSAHFPIFIRVSTSLRHCSCTYTNLYLSNFQICVHSSSPFVLTIQQWL